MKKIRLLLCVLFVLSLTVLVLTVGANASDNVSVWDGISVNSSWYNKSASTLYINNAADLAAFAGANKSFSGKTVILNCDIVWSAGDASEWSEVTAPSVTWTPIGIETDFRGTFDGNGHTISGLYYSGNGNEVGFFANLKGATVKNLNITNSYFQGRTKIGSITGSATGGNVTIQKCSSDAYILSNYETRGDHHVGGIAGYLDGGSSYTVTIEDCAYTGNITSVDGCNIGGIVGMIKGGTETVTRCLATGTYTARNRVGGIVGRSYLSITISDCYANVDLITYGTANQGGIIGSLRTTDTSDVPVVTITGCYYNGSNLHATYSAIGLFASVPTRIGNGEYDSTYTYGTMATSSTYYTDSTDDNSGSDQGNQAAIPSGVKKLGGRSAFLSAKSATFTTNLYGDVVLKTLPTPAEHDHALHAGAWVSDNTTGGQKAECLVPGCRTVVKRGGSLQIVGASVRYDSPAGIRVLTKVDKNSFFNDLYTGNDANYTYSGANVTFGTLIIPEYLLAGELTAQTEHVVNVVAKKMYNVGEYAQDANKLYFTSVLVNFPERINTYNCALMVRSYMKYTNDLNEVVYVYTDTKSVTFRDTAARVYDSSSSAVKQGLNMILALGSIDDGFFADEPNRVLLLENANKTLFDNFAASLESQGYTKHTKYDYAGNSFALYYNNDFVVSFYYTPKSIGNYVEDNRNWEPGKPGATTDMTKIAKAVHVADIYNVMRVIVEKRSTVDLPGTEAGNFYNGIGVSNSIAYAFPNNNYTNYGMGYIIQLHDGSFIIIDSGNDADDTRDSGLATESKTDSDYIMEYLLAHYPSSHKAKPVIAAWIFTHRHGDHVDGAKAFASKYYDDVVLEQVIYNFMSGDTAVPTGSKDQERFGEDYFKKYFPEVKICKAHTGYRFYIRNAEVRILYSIDDLMPESWEGMFGNNESIVFDVIIDETQKIKITGDLFIPGSRALVNMYGSELKSQVVQIAHHGNYGATLEVNRLFWPNDGTDYRNDNKYFVLLPNGRNEQARTRLGLAENAPFVNYLSENLNGKLKKIYVNGDLIFDSGVISSGYKVQYSDATIRGCGAIGRWKTLALYNSSDLMYYTPDPDILLPWPDMWN